jgi:multidrug resistance efflux pump
VDWWCLGALLFELDARPYEAEMARSKAQLELVGLEVKALLDDISAAEATVSDRQARATYAESHYERLKPLLQGNFTSADRVQRAQTGSRRPSSKAATAKAKATAKEKA